MCKLLPVFLGLALVLSAQTTPTRRIQANGTATVSVKPDTARVSMGVTTTATTAQDATSQNATVAQAVLDKLTQLLGQNADIKTLSYSLSPNYSYPPGGGNPTLLGYTATNTVQVTTADLTLPGKIIDTATQAGANRVDGLSFFLKDDSAPKGQALRLATIQAKQHADAIASGLSLHTGNVLFIQEGVTSTPVYAATGGIAASAAATPVQTGTVDVRADVTLQIEITQ